VGGKRKGGGGGVSDNIAGHKMKRVSGVSEILARYR